MIYTVGLVSAVQQSELVIYIYIYPLFFKTLMSGKIEGRRRRGRQRMKWLDGIINSMAMRLSKLWKTVKDRKASSAAVHGVTKSWTRLND